MNIQQNFSLKNLNTFGVEASARYYCHVTNVPELKEALSYAHEQQLSVLFLGGGSNILFTQDYDGLVIKLDLKGISEEIINEREVLVTAQAGEGWHEFVQFCLNKNYGGLENLSLIPGNVGTSPMQNIGAYGTEIKDAFVRCAVLNLETLEEEELDAEECRFGYRESIFKNSAKGKYVILSVTFKLTTRAHKILTEYGAIQNELRNMGISSPTIQQVSQAVIRIRQSKLPDPKMIGNAGSFFKNPTVSFEQFQTLKQQFNEMPSYPFGERVKIPAGWLIEQCGWKGRQIGNVATHAAQSLVIINKTGNATGNEIFNFSARIIVSVQQHFGVTLEREVNIIPDHMAADHPAGQ